MSFHEKTKTASKEIEALLSKVNNLLDAETTVVFWEDQLLKEKSGLLQWFEEQEKNGSAKIMAYPILTVKEMAKLAEKLVKDREMVFTPDALDLLMRQYLQREKALRLAEKLRAADLLNRDERMWWFTQVLEQACLLGKSPITVEVMREVLEHVESTSVFEVVNAVASQNWSSALTLLRNWEKNQDESAYFGLWSLLRVHFRKLIDSRTHEAQGVYGLKLLAEIEILIKNTQITAQVLTELCFLRLQTFNQQEDSLLSFRKLWLSTLPLS